MSFITTHHLRIFVYLFCFCCSSVAAQSRFKGGILAGFNVAQMDGDEAWGYNKLGLNAGLRSVIVLKPKTELTLDILYSQRGSRTTETQAPEPRHINLHYLEVPILLHYKDWLVKSADNRSYYKASIQAGLSYGRLFNVNSNDGFKFWFPRLEEKLVKNDWSLTAGITFMFRAHWGIAARTTQSLNWLYDPRNYASDPVLSQYQRLKGYFLSFQTIYIF